jgi:hypothetical protein
MNVPTGTKVLLGRPAVPMNGALLRSIAELVKSVPGIVESHVPQCYIPAVMKSPAQILVVVIDESAANAGSILGKLNEGLARLALPGHQLDVLPMLPGDQLLPAVRSKDCNVERLATADFSDVNGIKTKKRWKFW